MESSIWRRDSSSRYRLAVACLAVVVGAPLLWLAALQIGYIGAYPACGNRNLAWVQVPTSVAIVLSAVMALRAWQLRRRARGTTSTDDLLSLCALAIAALIVIVLIASAIGPTVLNPCD